MKTRQDVITAIENLLENLEENRDSWENPTLPRYLEAMGSWLEDDGNKYNPTPSWDFIIEMLSAAKIYESVTRKRMRLCSCDSWFQFLFTILT